MNNTQNLKSSFESTFQIKSRDITYGNSMNITMVPPELEFFKDNRHKEKSEMQDLNNRLENYLAVSRGESDANQKLTQELEDIKNGIKKETNDIKATFEAELGQLRNLLDDIEHDKNQVILIGDNNDELCKDLEKRIQNFKDMEKIHLSKIRQLDNLLSNYGGKMNQLQQKLGFLCEEKDRDNESINKLRSDIEAAKNDLSNEILLRSDAKNRCQSIDEDIEFTKEVHQRELSNMIALADYDPVNQSMEWWNDEFARCIKEIQDEYEIRLNSIQNDMDCHYTSKIQDVETNILQSSAKSDMLDQYSTLESSNTELGDQTSELEKKNALLKEQNDQLTKGIKDIQSQFETLITEKNNEMLEIRKHFDQSMAELQGIVDDNLSLQMEIMSYKKLLECEELRIGIKPDNENQEDQKEQVIEPITETVPKRKKPERKISYQRSSKGPLTISDCKSDGSYILIENMDQYDGQNLGGWRLVQNVDGLEEYDYTFGRFFLGPGESVKIWADGAGPREVNDLVWDDMKRLGVGEKVITTLINQKGKEKSSYTQKAIYKV